MRISDWSSDVCSSDLSRSEFAPEVPTFKEQGINLINGSQRGFVAPAGLPPEVKAKLLDAFRKAAADPKLQIGRAHVCTPVTNAQLVCRLLLEKKKHQH